MTAQPTNLSGLDLRAEIDRVRKDRKAVILAHYYQKPEIQDLADFVGDSLELSRKAAATDAEVIASSGDEMFDNSAVNAVNKASPLPVPNDKELFAKEFRPLTFVFNPK